MLPSRGTILVCDDDTHIVRTIQLRLERSGFEVKIANDGLAALEIVKQSHVDLIITDHQMPRLRGLELCQRVRELPHTQLTPMVLLTARAYEMDIEQIQRDFGLIDVLIKPFSPRDLLALVEQRLGLTAFSRQASPETPTQTSDSTL